VTRYLLAVDAGTGSCRAVLFDDLARQVGVSLREWTHREPPGVPGGQDFDVATNWELITACIRDVLAAAGVRGAEVAAVATTSMREGIVLFDAAGQEIWACPNVDSRAGQEAAELVTSGQAEAIYAQAGDWVSITSPARLRWLGRHAPDVLARTASVGMLSDWITYRLCGVHVTEPSCGSSSGMFDLSARTWATEITSACGLPLSALPPVYEPATVVGAVTAAVAEATSLRAGTPVVTGGADTQLGLAGAGIGVGQLAIVAGTFWQTAVVLDAPTVDPQARLRTLCHAVPGQWMLEGIGFYSGMSMRWLRDAFCDAEVAEAARRGVDPYVVMEERAAAIPAGSNGVVAVLSNVMNARRWVHASPSFVQFDLANPSGTGKAACVRAVEEAGAYVARAHRDVISEVTGRNFGEVVFTGGAAKGALWPQIIADVLGTTVHVPAVTESSALGAAVAAGVGVGVFDSMSAVPGLAARTRTLRPDPAGVAAYEVGYASWQRIYDRLLEISEDGVLRPLWRAAGADSASSPVPITTHR
jgi:autoinducer-2 kinase